MDNKLVRIFMPLCFLVLLASCSVQYVGTQSGKPEMTVKSSAENAWKPIRTTMKLYGYNEVSQVGNQIAFIKSLDGEVNNANDAWKQLQFPAHTERTTFTLLQNGETITIVPTVEMIANMGTPQESKIDVTKCGYYPDLVAGIMSQFINDGLGL